MLKPTLIFLSIISCYWFFKFILDYFGIYYGCYKDKGNIVFYFNYIKIGHIYEDKHGNHVMITFKNKKRGFGGYNISTNEKGVILTPPILAKKYKRLS